jgi:hypothetical protein
MDRSIVGRISCDEEIGDVYNRDALLEREACWFAKVCWHADHPLGMFLTRSFRDREICRGCCKVGTIER